MDFNGIVWGIEEPSMGEPSNSGALARGLSILVVDDNRDSAETITLMVEMWGHAARTVHDGPAAVDACLQFRPDVVLLDIGLPGMNGFEVARRLREQEGMDNLLLVAMTGYGQEEDRQLSREAGFNHHMVKPIEPAELRALLANAAANA
jgi:CheY-like chemotaxis protein